MNLYTKGESMIELKKSAKLFDEVALEWADSISRGGMNKNQLRNFYDKVLELYEKSLYTENFEEEVLPFVKMLNSKVAYAVNRGVANNDFKKMMNDCISQIKTKKDLEVFKYFFEAIVGFYKGGK